MKKFKFKLNKVLEVREIEEELAQNKLLDAQEKARAIKKEINSLESVQEQLYDYIREKEDSSFQENILYRNYIQNNRSKICQTENALNLQQKEVAHSRNNYLEKRKKKEVLEKIKEKEYRRFQKEFLLKEQKELDEISLNRKGLGGL